MTEMTMDVHQEAKIKGSQETAQIIKGKRTKRQRPASPLVLAITSTSSSAGESSPLSPVSSVEFAESNITVGEEEEDMANCLILLAQGHHQAAAGKSSEPAAAADLPTTGSSSSKLGHQRLYVYQCKTCNRCFPSFQALGGHRASHKKPTNKANNEEKKEDSEEDHHQRRSSNNINIVSTTLSLQMAEEKGLCSSNAKSNKVHECSICGAEFSSGQALGGHMRRHRAIATTATSSTATVSLGRISPDESQESKKPRNSQQLDLNLPAAPEDDLQETKFPFESNKQVLIFSASALVDCHY